MVEGRQGTVRGNGCLPANVGLSQPYLRFAEAAAAKLLLKRSRKAKELETKEKAVVLRIRKLDGWIDVWSWCEATRAAEDDDGWVRVSREPQCDPPHSIRRLCTQSRDTYPPITHVDTPLYRTSTILYPWEIALHGQIYDAQFDRDEQCECPGLSQVEILGLTPCSPKHEHCDRFPSPSALPKSASTLSIPYSHTQSCVHMCVYVFAFACSSPQTPWKIRGHARPSLPPFKLQIPARTPSWIGQGKKKFMNASYYFHSPPMHLFVSQTATIMYNIEGFPQVSKSRHCFESSGRDRERKPGLALNARRDSVMTKPVRLWQGSYEVK